MCSDQATLALPFPRFVPGVCALFALVIPSWPASFAGSSPLGDSHGQDSPHWIWPWSSRDDDRRGRFEQALLDAGSGDPRRQRRALETMNDLAPHRRPGGYLPAHEWLAEHHTALARRERDPSGQRYHLDLAETHWMRVLILDRDHQAAHMHLAHLYMSLFRFDRAEWHLKYLLEHGHDDAVQLHLAEVYLRTDRPEEAQRCAAAAPLRQNPGHRPDRGREPSAPT